MGKLAPVVPMLECGQCETRKPPNEDARCPKCGQDMKEIGPSKGSPDNPKSSLSGISLAFWGFVGVALVMGIYKASDYSEHMMGEEAARVALILPLIGIFVGLVMKAMVSGMSWVLRR